MVQQSAFLTKLPTEIRLKIYGHVLAQAKPISLLDLLTDDCYKAEFRRNAAGIMFACAQSYHEVHNLIWEVNTVKFSLVRDYLRTNQRAFLSHISHTLRSLVLEVLPTTAPRHLSTLRCELQWVQEILDAAQGLAELTIAITGPFGWHSTLCDDTLRCFAKLRFKGKVVVKNMLLNPVENMRALGTSAECVEEVKAAIRRGSEGQQGPAGPINEWVK